MSLLLSSALTASFVLFHEFVGSLFQLSGHSMEPNLHDSQFVFVGKTYSYLQRGDIVVIKPFNNGRFHIKRIVGLPGEVIRFMDGNIFIKYIGENDFHELQEDYLGTGKVQTFLPKNIEQSEFLIPEKNYFVLGDNRNNSSDSRQCFSMCSSVNTKHFISSDQVVGRVIGK